MIKKYCKLVYIIVFFFIVILNFDIYAINNTAIKKCVGSEYFQIIYDKDKISDEEIAGLSLQQLNQYASEKKINKSSIGTCKQSGNTFVPNVCQNTKLASKFSSGGEYYNLFYDKNGNISVKQKYENGNIRVTFPDKFNNQVAIRLVTDNSMENILINNDYKLKGSYPDNQFLNSYNGTFTVNTKPSSKFTLEFYDMSNNECHGNLIYKYFVVTPNESNIKVDNPAKDKNTNEYKLCLTIKNDDTLISSNDGQSDIRKLFIPECYSDELIATQLPNLYGTINNKYTFLKTNYQKDSSVTVEPGKTIGSNGSKECSGSSETTCLQGITKTNRYIKFSNQHFMVECQETFSTKGSTPKLVIAGGGFSYQNDYAINKECKIVFIGARAVKKPQCSCATTCFTQGYSGDGLTTSDPQSGGPNDDFDSCVNKCDGGNYSQSCINKCYTEVYGDNTKRNKFLSKNLDDFFDKAKENSSKFVKMEGEQPIDQGQNPGDTHNLTFVGDAGTVTWTTESGAEHQNLINNLLANYNITANHLQSLQTLLSMPDVLVWDYNTESPPFVVKTSDNDRTAVGNPAKRYEFFGGACAAKISTNFCQGRGGFCVVSIVPGGCSWNPELEYKLEISKILSSYSQALGALHAGIPDGEKVEFKIVDSHLKYKNNPYIFVASYDNGLLEKNVTSESNVRSFIGTVNIGSEGESVPIMKAVSSKSITATLPFAYLDKQTGDAGYASKGYFSKGGNGSLSFIDNKNNKFVVKPFEASKFYDGANKYYTSIYSKNINVYYTTKTKLGYPVYELADNDVCMNIYVNASNFGDSQFSTVNKCYYGVYNYGTSGDKSGKGMTYIFRPIELTDIFPDREPRWNWTAGASLNLNGPDPYLKYNVNPPKTIEDIEKLGNTIINNPEYLDYEIIINRGNSAEIKKFNSQKGNSYTKFNMNCDQRTVSLCSSEFLEKAEYISNAGNVRVKAKVGTNND